MSAVADIGELYDQLTERASGPDRELDCLIQVAMTPDAKCMTDPGHGTVGSSFGVMRDIDFDVWRQHRTGVLGPFYYGEPPAYTASIDAAMTLVPEGWLINLSVDTNGADVILIDDRINPVRLPDAVAQAATPALALTAAALRARST